MQTSLIIAIIYTITAAILHALLMYDLRRDLRLFGPQTALMFAVGLAMLMFAVGLAMLCALWPFVILICLIAPALFRRKGGAK